MNKTTSLGKVGFIAFGSDQGLVGKFNDALVSHLLNTMKSLPGEKRVWAIGERIQTHLSSLKIPNYLRMSRYLERLERFLLLSKSISILQVLGCSNKLSYRINHRKN